MENNFCREIVKEYLSSPRNGRSHEASSIISKSGQSKRCSVVLFHHNEKTCGIQGLHVVKIIYLGSVLCEKILYMLLVRAFMPSYHRPQTKLRKGNVFTSACQEFCPRGGVHPLRQTPPGQTLPIPETPTRTVFLYYYRPQTKFGAR